MSPSHRNQSIHWQSKSTDWFLYFKHWLLSSCWMAFLTFWISYEVGSFTSHLHLYFSWLDKEVSVRHGEKHFSKPNILNLSRHWLAITPISLALEWQQRKRFRAYSRWKGISWRGINIALSFLFVGFCY